MTADYALIENLLNVAHEAVSLESIEPGEWAEIPFVASNGWTVVVFYDCGDLDYIDHFLSPTGERLGLWDGELDPRLDDAPSEDVWPTLRYWRGRDSTSRLLKIANERSL